VVDSNVIGRIDEGRDELQKLLKEDELRNAVQKLGNRLRLNSITNRA
jgi:hypothetical protein